MRVGVLLAAVAGSVVFGLPGVSGAQTDPHAAMPERPSVSTHAHTVAPGWVEVEAGFARERANGRFGDQTFPLALKLGAAPRLQLNVGTAISHPADGQVTSVNDVSVGVKWRFAEGVPLGGDLAILPTVTLPTESNGLMTASVLVIASRTLGSLSLDVNAGYTGREGDGGLAPKHESMWAAAVSGPLPGRFGWLGELSGSPATSGTVSRAATFNSLVGATAALKPSLVLDIAVSAPISGPDHTTVLFGGVWNAGALWGSRSARP